MKTHILIIIMFAGCASEPHVAHIKATSGECSVVVDLVIQQDDDIILKRVSKNVSPIRK